MLRNAFGLSIYVIIAEFIYKYIMIYGIKSCSKISQNDLAQ